MCIKSATALWTNCERKKSEEKSSIQQKRGNQKLMQKIGEKKVGARKKVAFFIIETLRLRFQF